MPANTPVDQTQPQLAIPTPQLLADEKVSLTTMMTEYADLRLKYDSVITRVNTLEEAIKAHVKETGETCSGIVVGTPYQRINWRTAQLVELSAQLPEILLCKTETTVRPVRLDWLVAGSC